MGMRVMSGNLRLWGWSEGEVLMAFGRGALKSTKVPSGKEGLRLAGHLLCNGGG